MIDRLAEEVGFLKALVRVPSDNPPGDCAPHAEVAAAHLEKMGFTAERHAVPAEVVEAYGMISVTNLVVREKFGTGRGPTIDISPRSTFQSCGSSSRFDFRRTRPSGVTRGSSCWAHTGPVSRSASSYMERNFTIVNGLPSSPIRSWR